MKKRLLLLLVLLAPLSLFAQQSATADKVKGVWQQVQTAKNDGRLIRLPVWKVLQGDGTFCTFLIGDETGLSLITNQGTYEWESDTTFVEHVTGSITDPQLVGKDNRLYYQFEGNDLMRVRYRVPGASRDGRETWVRVKLQVPREAPDRGQ